MKIAIAGTRGIPARYGGFETFAEELAIRLAARGHAVTVYGRHALGTAAPKTSDYQGVTLRSTPTIMQKYLETPLHAFSTFIDLLFRDIDVVLLCNAANSPFSWILIPTRKRLLTNVDGIERNRAKWNAFGKLWYRLGEQSAVWFSDRIIADADMIRDYYAEVYRCRSEVIAYGATVRRREPGPVLKQFELDAGKYLLYVSRLEPENNALGVIEAYTQIPNPSMPLVIVGDAPYADEYKAKLRERANNSVIFTGFQFGEAYQELRTNCYLYVQATEVGGTHPALVEAMAYGNCVVANRVPEHEEVLGDCGRYYAKNDFGELAQIFTGLMQDPDAVREWGAKAEARAKERYSWERVTGQYEELFGQVMRGGDA